jgi:hypothetical protein
MSALKTLRKKRSQSNRPFPIMNLVADDLIAETGNQFIFSTSLGRQNSGDAFSGLSREQLGTFLDAESGNVRSAHFSVPQAEPPPPTPEKGLAVGVLKQAAYDLRRFREATKPADREVYRDAHSWITGNDFSWPYSFMNVCKLLDLCPEAVREELLADASLGPFHYWIRRAGRLSRKLGASVVRALESCRNPEASRATH